MNAAKPLTDSDLSTLSNICRVAAERFHENAATFRSMVHAPTPKPNEVFAVRGPAAAALADQFVLQAEKALAMASRFDMAEGVFVLDGFEDAA